MSVYTVGGKKVCVIDDKETRDSFINFPCHVDILICSYESWTGNRKTALIPVIKEGGQLILLGPNG